MIMKDQFNNIVNNISQASFVSYQIIFYRSRQPADLFLPLCNVKVGITTFYSQQHSASIAGSYFIYIDNQPLLVNMKKQIPATATSWDLTHAFNLFYNSSEISVNQVADTYIIDQIVYTICYIGIDNPLPLSINPSLLTGGVNSNFTAIITTNRNFTDDSLFFSSIPL